MASQNVETLREGYAAFGRGDIPAVMELFDPDIEWVTPDSTPLGGRRKGRDEVMGFFGLLPQYFSEIRVEPVEFIDGGDTVVVIARDIGTTSKGTYESRLVHVWRMRDGKAVAFEEFLDTALTNQMLGQPAMAAGE